MKGADSSRSSIPPVWILLVIIVLAIAWFVGRATDLIGTPFGQERFNSAVWQASKTERQREARARMARDLIDHYLRPGMSESSLISLLGRPDKTWHRSEYTPPEPHDVYEYNMGSAPMDIAGQSYVLRLYFDVQARYRQAEITRD